MSKEKQVNLIKRAIKEFFILFPECADCDFDAFFVAKFKTVYRVELVVEGKSYVHYMAK